jgi:hypothetical protein
VRRAVAACSVVAVVSAELPAGLSAPRVAGLDAYIIAEVSLTGINSFRFVRQCNYINIFDVLENNLFDRCPS